MVRLRKVRPRWQCNYTSTNRSHNEPGDSRAHNLSDTTSVSLSLTFQSITLFPYSCRPKALHNAASPSAAASHPKALHNAAAATRRCYTTPQDTTSVSLSLTFQSITLFPYSCRPKALHNAASPSAAASHPKALHNAAAATRRCYTTPQDGSPDRSRTWRHSKTRYAYPRSLPG